MKRNKQLGTKVSLKTKKVKPNAQTKVIYEHLTSLLLNVRRYMTSTETTKFVQEFHKNQLKLINDALYFGETASSNALSSPSKNELIESNININDIPYKRICAFLQLEMKDAEQYDDLPNITEGDRDLYAVCIYAAFLTIHEDYIQLKVAKGNRYGNWYFDAYYFKLPLDIIERYLNGMDMDIEIRLGFELQELPSDEYLISHCTRFLKFILDQMFKMKVHFKNEYDVYKSEVHLQKGEKHTFKIYQPKMIV